MGSKVRKFKDNLSTADDLIRNGGSVLLGGDGLGESYVFDKKTIEEARLAKIKRDGRVMTKKELRESLLK